MAKFTPTAYDIIYHPEGGTHNNPSTYTIESETIILGDAVRPGYDFLGWYDNAAFSGNPVTEITQGTIGNIELWAKWSDAIVYSITYHTNGGTHSNPLEFTIESETIVLTAAEKTGYSFEGWYSNPEFSNAPVTEIPQGTVGEIELWAKHSPIAYSIEYHTQGGTHNNPSTYTIESETIILGDAVRPGYDFLGWYDNATFSGNPVTEITQGTIGNIELWAKWLNLFYKVTFRINNQDGPIENARVSINNDSIYSNALGISEIELVNGDYLYSVSAQGHEDIPNKRLIVQGADIEVDVLMISTIVETYLQEQILVYPNPVKDILFVEIPKQVVVVKLEVVDSEGRVVLILDNLNNPESIPINFESFQHGMYFIKALTQKGKQVVIKVI